jgi:tetratricopeptide (TPR) repeat protein
MGNVIRFPAESPARFGFERVRSTYSVRDLSQQFGVSETHIRRWTREGLIRTTPEAGPGELRYDFRALMQFRRLRDLRGEGLTPRQMYAELRGQLNLFSEPTGQLIALPRRLSLFELALELHERADAKTPEAYRAAIRDGDYAADAYCNLGIWEFETGRAAAAFDCFTQGLKLDPRHFESHFNLANLYFEGGENRLARLHYEMAAQIEPSFPNLHFNLALVHATEGELKAAIAALSQYRELAPPEEVPKSDELLSSLQRVVAAHV